MGFRNELFILFVAALLAPSFAYAETRNIVFPVDGETTFRDDFLEPRDGGARQHLGIDVLADKMTPLVAAVDGVVSFIPCPEPSYGYMITIQDKDRYQYRYIHVNNDTPGTDDGAGGCGNAYAPDLKRGSKVSAGQFIGWVGDSGNAEETVPHLHFEIRRPDRTAIDPYESLLAAATPENVSGTYVEHEHEDAGEAGVEEGAEFIFTIELRENMQGEAIQELQSRLKDAGFFTYPYLTQYFGPITKDALEKYQRANGIAPTGVLGFETRALLNGETVSSGAKLLLKRELFEGMQGETVHQVQLKLEALGYFSGDANGIFDSNLREAVRRFQVASGLPPTGYVSYATWNTLTDLYAATPSPVAGPTESTPESGTYVFTLPLSIGSRGNEVTELQCFLQELGFFAKNVECTGYFGPITESAVTAFQASRGIEAIGIVGPKTRAALNAI